MYRYAILTSSDAASRGEREDTSAEAIRQMLDSNSYYEVEYKLVPDEQHLIEATLISWVDTGDIDLIITTGGTGLSQRDLTPEATIAVAHRIVPGLSELMRAFGSTKTPMASLSRGMVVTRNQTLIINLPGSPKGAREGIEALQPILLHALGQATGKNRGH